DIDDTLSGERTISKDGSLTVSATAVSYSDEDKTVRVYAAAYDDNNTLISAAASDEKELKANSSLSEELTLKASDSDTVALYLWDSATQEPLADKLTVTKIKEDNLLLFYDFENPSDTASMLFGGASVESGKGISGNGLVFNGADGYMQLPNNIMTDSMTIMGWIKTDTLQSWARFFDFGADTANNFFYSPSGGRVESVVGGAADTMDVTAYANTGIWEHYAVTRTADKVQLYRNGELVSEQSCSRSVTGIPETTNYIGRSHWAADKYFCGAMDEIKIYNKICTAEEIKTMYNIYAEKLTADAAYKDYSSLGFGTTELTDGTELPSAGDNGSEITWESTDSSIISGNTITGPAAGEADKPAVLTATVKNGGTVYTKTFNVTVLAAPSIKGLADYSMSDVLMTNEYLINANEKMTAYLKKFDVDTSVSGFRRTAGLSSGSVTYGGWETSLIAGHGIGHFVSALAQGYKYSTSGTADNELLTLSNEMIDALYEAQAHEDKTVNGQTL
ncbi:MAG: LamG-like jellyroll fold domain-containing protein, partial [Candidatus Ornithomonoglobus sp.]